LKTSKITGGNKMLKNTETGNTCERLEKENKELRARIRKLERLAYLDSLTKLIYTKNGFDHELVKHIGDLKSWSYLFIDVDNFKEINRILGHLGADQVLKRIITTVLKRLREEPYPFIMYRPYGGDEIGVILFGAGEREAVVSAQDVLDAVSSDDILKRRAVTISIGVSGTGFEKGILDRRSIKREFSILRRRADFALSESKERGRNRVCWWSETGLCPFGDAR
jgi:diguanylate cyclase (GGDEF)-like protein